MRAGGTLTLGLALLLLVVAAVGRADDAAGSPKARLAAIEAAQKAARDRYAAELKTAGSAEPAQKAAVDRYLAEVLRNVGAALALARECRDDPSAFEALKFVIRTNGSGPGNGPAKALRMILERDYVRLPNQGNYTVHVALRLFQYPEAETLLRRVLDENPRREDKASACYHLAEHLAAQARIVRKFRAKPEYQKNYEQYTEATPIGRFMAEKDPEELDRRAEALLERVKAEFADVKFEGGDDRPLGAIAEGELFAFRSLGVGKMAPDVAGLDHEGKAFKLSDYRGKIVVLTFSGNWCGPCVAMYPSERALAARLKDKPFALLSVNTDQEKASLSQSIAKGDVTWRCWWDGGTDGPITTRWGISRFPSIFVLDRSGVIRFKNVRDDDLDRAVMSLMDEGKE